MDTSTPGQDSNSASTPGTSIPISNGLGASTPPVGPTFDSLPSVAAVTPDPSPTTPVVPSSPLSPLPPMTPEPPAPSPEPELTLKPKGGGLKKVLPWFVAVVLAVGAAGGVYFWQSSQLSSVKADAKADKDTLNKRVATLQTQVDEATASTSTPTEEEKPAAATGTDQDLIKALLKADCESEVALKFFEAKDIKVEGSFATIKNGCDSKSRTTSRFNNITTKKVSGTWVIVYEGTAVKPGSSIMTKFGIPASLYE